MSSWFFSSSTGLYYLDKTLPINMVPTNSQLFPSIWNSNQAVGIATSNLEDYTLKVNGSGYFLSNLNLNNSNNNLSYNANFENIQAKTKNGFDVLGSNNNTIFAARNNSMTINPTLITTSLVNSGQIDTVSIQSSTFQTNILSILNSSNIIQYQSNINIPGGLDIRGARGVALGSTSNSSVARLFVRDDAISAQAPIFSSFLSNTNNIQTTGLKSDYLQIISPSNYLNYDPLTKTLNFIGERRGLFGTSTTGNVALVYDSNGIVTIPNTLITSTLSNSGQIQTVNLRANAVVSTALVGDFLQIKNSSNYLNANEVDGTLNFVASKRGVLGTANTIALNYDSNGAVTIPNNLGINGTLTSSITTFSSNTAAWASNNIVSAVYASNIAARQSVHVNLTTETFLFYYGTAYGGAYPIGDGMKTIDEVPNAIFYNSFTANSTRARLVMRAIPNIQNQVVTGPLDCYLTIMRCTSASWNDWTPFLTASGANATMYLDTTRFFNGARTGVSDWFVYPSGVSGPLWLGVRIDTNSSAMNTYGLYYMNSYLEVY